MSLVLEAMGQLAKVSFPLNILRKKNLIKHFGYFLKINYP